MIFTPPCIHSHLQDVIQGLSPKGPARVEQSVARLLHLVYLPPRGLGVPLLCPLQTFAAALELLAHVFEPTHIPGREEGKGTRKISYDRPASVSVLPLSDK